MKAVYSFTLRSLMRRLKTYIFLAVMILSEGAFITYINFWNHYSAIEYSLEFTETVFMLTLPLITAEIFALDRENGFEKTLLATGVPLTSLLIGRLLAILTVFAVPYALLLIMPPVLGIFGTVNLASAYASILTYLLLAVAFISLTVFISVSAKKRIYSYIISYGALLLCYFLGTFSSLMPSTRGLNLLWLTLILITVSAAVWLFTRSALAAVCMLCIGEGLLVLFYFVTPRAFSKALSSLFDLLSPCSALNNVIYGPFDLTEVIHLLLFAAVFVLLSFLQLKRRKYE